MLAAVVLVPVLVLVPVPVVVVDVVEVEVVDVLVESSPPPHAVNPSPVRAVATISKRCAWRWLVEKVLDVFMVLWCWLC